MCPLGYLTCEKCEFRQEVNDCGYNDEMYYEKMVQEMAKEGIEVVRQQPSRIITGVANIKAFKEALYRAVLKEYYDLGYRLVEDAGIITLYSKDSVVLSGDEVTTTIKSIEVACYVDAARRAG
jgi:hypothetical protein